MPCIDEKLNLGSLLNGIQYDVWWSTFLVCHVKRLFFTLYPPIQGYKRFQRHTYAMQNPEFSYRKERAQTSGRASRLAAVSIIFLVTTAMAYT